MQNLKIRVNNKPESKEIMNLLDMAGYTKGLIDNISKPCWIAVLDGKEYSDYMLSKSIWYTANPKEITLPELRAMAEPKMKEYLIPDRNYEYILTDAREGLEPHAKDWIEIPDGAECSTKCKDHNEKEWLLFWKGDYKFCVGHDKEWFHFESGVNEYLDDWSGLANIIWQREQDEPFLTPECTLNDQYAEIEEVRQHNHYFKDVSNLNEIDVYMVLKLFNVTDPCLQHIAKKALCAGQRGHKDFKKDLQDILDTAKRAVEINNG